MTGKGTPVPTAGDDAEAGAVEPRLSESLHRKLTAHRTKALQVLLSGNAHVALAAVVHTLLQQLVMEHAYRADSALALRATGCEGALAQFADDLQGSRTEATLWSVSTTGASASRATRASS